MSWTGGNGWWGSPTLPVFPRAIWVKSNFITDFWCKVLLWVGVNPPPTHEDNEKRNDFLSCLGALIDDWWLVAGLWTTVLFLPLKHQNKWQFFFAGKKWVERCPSPSFCRKKNEAHYKMCLLTSLCSGGSWSNTLTRFFDQFGYGVWTPLRELNVFIVLLSRKSSLNCHPALEFHLPLAVATQQMWQTRPGGYRAALCKFIFPGGNQNSASCFGGPRTRNPPPQIIPPWGIIFPPEVLAWGGVLFRGGGYVFSKFSKFSKNPQNPK